MKALLVALAALSWAKEPPARVVAVVGRVEVEKGRAAKPAREGLALEDGQRLRTWDAAAAVVELADGSRLKLRENSRLELALGRNGVRLHLGGVFAKLTSQPRNRNFTVSAGAVTAAVRGTQFFTALSGKSARGDAVWLCVNEGEVEVKAEKTPGTVLVKAGKGIKVEPGKPLPKPGEFEWTKKLNWNMEPGKGRIDDRARPSGASEDSPWMP